MTPSVFDSEPTPQPQGLDLSAVRGGPGPAGVPAAGPDGGDTVQVPGLVFDATEETFNTVVEISAKVPVLVDLWADWCEPCKQLSPILERVVESAGGKLVLAKVDVDANPRIQQLFGAQSIPTVVAIVAGQPVPLFQGAQPEPQVRAYTDELLKLAAANGVNGTAVAGDQDQPEPEPESRHPEADAALEAGDLEGAESAYRRALAEAPGDEEARIGLARVGLIRRTSDADADAVRGAAASDSTDVDAALAVADLDLIGGHVDDAFNRLLGLIRTSAGEERERVRLRLIELFDLVGPSDPRVNAARSALMRALF